MIETARIVSLAERIAATAHPNRIILFGSHARGDATADSDVDLLVLMPYEGHPSRTAAEILTRVNPGFSVDLLVRTPSQFQERLDLGDFFMQEILDTGKVLYEAANR